VGARAKQRVEEAIEEPCQQKHRQQDKRSKHETHAPEKEPALQCVLSRLIYAADQQSVVAAVGAPGDVEHVAEDWNRSDYDFDGDVGHHARDRDIRDAANPGCDDDDAGGDAADQVADARDEADDAIEAKADRGAGNFDEVIEQVRQEVEVLVVERLAAAFDAG